MIAALQTIVSRNTNPLHEIVISVTQIHAGTTSRTSSPRTPGSARRSAGPSKATKARIEQIVAGHAAAYGRSGEDRLRLGLSRHCERSRTHRVCVRVAEEVAGAGAVVATSGREMGAEDFPTSSKKRPGCYLFLGQGDGAGLHREVRFQRRGRALWRQLLRRIVERPAALIPPGAHPSREFGRAPFSLAQILPPEAKPTQCQKVCARACPRSRSPGRRCADPFDPKGL